MSLYTETMTTADRKRQTIVMSGCRAPKADGLGDLNPIQRGTTAAIHKIVSLVSFRNSAVAEPRSAKPIEAYAALPLGVVECCSDMLRRVSAS